MKDDLTGLYYPDCKTVCAYGSRNCECARIDLERGINSLKPRYRILWAKTKGYVSHHIVRVELIKGKGWPESGDIVSSECTFDIYNQNIGIYHLVPL